MLVELLNSSMWDVCDGAATSSVLAVTVREGGRQRAIHHVSPRFRGAVRCALCRKPWFDATRIRRTWWEFIALFGEGRDVQINFLIGVENSTMASIVLPVHRLISGVVATGY